MTIHTSIAALLIGTWLGGADHGAVQPEILRNRTIHLTQTVTLHDIPAGTKQVRLWVPVPSDTSWQRVVDCKVASAPGTWKLVRQDQGRGDFVYSELSNASSDTATVVFECTVSRQAVHFPMDDVAEQAIQPELFKADLDQKAPLMEVDAQIKELADKYCGAERDPAKQALLLLKAVADNEDHYSKDPSKPKCGRGSAIDCIEHGGGCCTDLHSLYIALARARGIPARIQYGYRLLDDKAGQSYDPGYRCWVEFFVSGAGWVPTDIVAADAADQANPYRWASLSAERVWLWQGRSFQLNPTTSAGRVDTMTCGWAEIDGKAVDPLPSADGKTPAQLRRTVSFEILKDDRNPAQPKTPA